MTNQFTDEQVEASGRAVFEFRHPGESFKPERDVWAIAYARAALEAAAGVAPQAPGVCQTCDRAAAFCAHCVAEMEAAPVQPSSTVDEIADLSPRRLKSCVEAWPECQTGEYNPSCCRFPKSCSATVYSAEYVTEDDLEPCAVVEAIGGESRGE